MMRIWMTVTMIFSLSCALALADTDGPVGVWQVANGDAKIEIYNAGDTLEGKIVWLKVPLDEKGQPKVDTKNPTESLRTQPILGMVLLKGFKKHDDLWEGGTIYDAKSGKTYKANVRMDGADKLKLRGYIGFSLLGRTEEWTRAK